MFTAYKIGITVALTNQVSSALGMIARDFVKTEAAATALKGRLKEIALLATSGAILGGLGYAGLRLTESLVKPATEYAHQLNIMNMAGLSHVEVAQAIGDAWRNTSTIITTTATGNLRMLLDLRNVLGSLAEAQAALPIVSKIQAVMASSSEEGVRRVASDNFAFNMAKALDIIGAARSPAEFERQAGMMSQVITAFQGRVTPAMFQSVFAYARQAKFGMSPEFMYQILPTLMLEYAQGTGGAGGGSRGVGPALAAFSRLTLQGYINKKAMPELQALGLLDASSALRTTTSGTTAGPLRGADLAAANPFLWVQRVLMPAIEQRYGGNATREQITQEIQGITRGNQLASQIILEFALKSQNFLRDQSIIRGAMPYGQAYQQALRNDPNFAYAALSAQWENLKTAFGTTVIPILIPGIIGLTGALNTFGRWTEAHPRIAEGLTTSFVALSAAMAFSGMVLTMAAGFRAIGLVLTVGGLAPKALTVLGANLGAAAIGFARMAGPLALVVGALALLGPSKSFTGSQQDWLRGRNLGDQSGPGDRLGAWWHGLFSPSAAGQAGSGSASQANASIRVAPGHHWDPRLDGGAASTLLQWFGSKSGADWMGQSFRSLLPGAYSGGAMISVAPGRSWDPALDMPGAKDLMQWFGSKAGVEWLAEAFKRALHGTSVQLDGKEVGQIVTDHQTNELRKPPADSSTLDTRLSPVWPNYVFPP